MPKKIDQDKIDQDKIDQDKIDPDKIDPDKIDPDKNNQDKIDDIKKRMEILENLIIETKSRLPAHSTKPPIMMELLDYEDEYAELEKKLNKLKDK